MTMAVGRADVDDSGNFVPLHPLHEAESAERAGVDRAANVGGPAAVRRSTGGRPCGAGTSPAVACWSASILTPSCARRRGLWCLLLTIITVSALRTP